MKRLEAQLAGVIERRVSYFNGWYVDQETMRKDCEKAAKAVLQFLHRRKMLVKGEKA